MQVGLKKKRVKIAKPETIEYDHFYQGYVDCVIDEDVLKMMEDQLEDFEDYLLTLPFDGLDYRYASDKWSIAEVAGHMVDVERMMSFRLFSFVRGDKQSLPSFDQDHYVKNGSFNMRSKNSLLEEFEGLRVANMKLIESFNEDDMMKVGVASDLEFSVRSLIYILTGHFQHHLNILKTKYIVSI